MNGSFYKKLVDIYAEDGLTEELAKEMDMASSADPDLAEDMVSLKRTVAALKTLPKPEFTEESQVRVLLMMQMRGAPNFEETKLDRQYTLPV